MGYGISNAHWCTSVDTLVCINRSKLCAHGIISLCGAQKTKVVHTVTWHIDFEPWYCSSQKLLGWNSGLALFSHTTAPAIRFTCKNAQFEMRKNRMELIFELAAYSFECHGFFASDLICTLMSSVNMYIVHFTEHSVCFLFRSF